METIIETKALTKRYKGKEAVHGIDIQLRAGSVCAFLGRNGAGKTTTIKMLAGLIRPDGGSSTVLGADSMALGEEHWQKIGYVSENQQLYEWMTGEELIAHTSAFYPGWDRDFERELVEQLELPLKRKISLCSRGEKVKFALLLAMAFRPQLLILDEPFAGLDPLARCEFLESVLEITTQNDWSVFFSTHDIDDVEKLADDILVIDEGRIQIRESLESLQGRFRLIDIVGEHAPVEVSGEILRLTREGDHSRFIHSGFDKEKGQSIKAGYPGAEVTVETMSLKEIFLVLAKKFQTENRKS